MLSRRIGILLLAFILIVPTIVFSVSITDCTSGYSSWTCESGSICKCTISGSCTDGNLLVYKTSVSNLLCCPSIINSIARIDWKNCGSPMGQVRVRADCEEGQSSEKIILITSKPSYTTTSTYMLTTSSMAHTTTTTVQAPSSSGKPIIGIILLLLVVGAGVAIFMKGKLKKEQPMKSYY